MLKINSLKSIIQRNNFCKLMKHTVGRFNGALSILQFLPFPLPPHFLVFTGCQFAWLFWNLAVLPGLITLWIVSMAEFLKQFGASGVFDLFVGRLDAPLPLKCLICLILPLSIPPSLPLRYSPNLWPSRDRMMLLKLEQDILEFINDDK